MSSTADEELLVSPRLFVSTDDVTGRFNAVLEDDDFTILLHLTEITQRKVIADYFAYSLGPVTKELHSPNGRQGSPVLMERFASEVAVFLREEPWAAITAGDRRGYSKCISSDGPFGHPWSQSLFEDPFHPSSNS